jgi:4-aminobutyrate aminotransferase-like enzyme
VVYRASLDRWAEGAHTGTFRGDQLAMAAGAATIRHIAAEGLAARAASLGDRLMGRLTRYQALHPVLGQVRGRGLMIGVEIVKDKKTKEYGAAERDRIVELAFERGVLFLGCGPSTLRIAPPLILTKEEADVAVDTLDECIAIVGKGA